ncbi:crotonobetainyl-CoA:carnitine CoA-transferase CaiB-like acyl-CoA transferase [Variovorax boronicumulans]|uniref:CaiB/BaiF CoA transferase family protein n=1 Tax=Variovorax boronicumulans TaxID=436515 RepID=UPI00247653ED|nr:CaiB/BaiF CoA-transferase family protein [Variovorax boronicumulans]MDH6164950.1 crotonobetainyl-CoA:carnitine CoA-transferase CaiB-like acyl-CoA transferase [Variovorax boronicumulans]
MEAKDKGPLAGIRVIDIGTMVAGPVAATLMADLGADVIKIEQPGRGDSLRHIGPAVEGESLWWNVEGRNKKSVTLDLHHPEGQRILKEMLKHADVLVENFRPGILAKWNLSWEHLKKVNPRLVMLSVSGYGQTGPYANRAGYDRIALAMGGTLNATGYPDRAPVKLGTAMADYSTALFGAYGIMVALYHRDMHGGEGQQIDLSLYETVFRFTDVMVTAFDKMGLPRERTGNLHFAAAPGDHFETCDGRYIVLTVSNDRMFGRLCEVIPALGDEERYSTHAKRTACVEELNVIVAAWIKSLPVLEVCRTLEEKGLAYSLIYSIKDIVADPHYEARGTIASVEHPQIGELKMPAVQPRFSGTPSPQIRPAPALGADTDAILRELAGLSAGQIAELRQAGTV